MYSIDISGRMTPRLIIPSKLKRHTPFYAIFNIPRRTFGITYAGICNSVLKIKSQCHNLTLLARFERTAAAIILNVAYGHQVADEGDDYVTLADQALSGLAKAGIFGAYLVVRVLIHM